MNTLTPNKAEIVNVRPKMTIKTRGGVILEPDQTYKAKKFGTVYSIQCNSLLAVMSHISKFTLIT